MIEADVFRALSDPTRRGLYELLAGGEQTVSALKANFDISQPAVSQHLAALKAAGLVAERREGRCAYYRVEPGGLIPLLDWIERTRAFWPERIERLKDVLKRMDQ